MRVKLLNTKATHATAKKKTIPDTMNLFKSNDLRVSNGVDFDVGRVSNLFELPVQYNIPLVHLTPIREVNDRKVV